MSTLYLVGTPIGNLEDLSPRALRVLNEVSVLAVEKWTDTIKLLKHFGLEPVKMINYDDRNSRKMTPKILEILESQDVALVTSAGMPGVSDPGAFLVAEARTAGHEIIPIPGPSALTAALSASGFSGSFWFVEFLPKTRGKIIKLFKQAEELGTNLIFFESTYRLIKTLTLIAELYPDKQVFLGKEMTKKFEKYLTGTAGDFLETASKNRDFKRGEFALIIHFD